MRQHRIPCTVVLSLLPTFAISPVAVAQDLSEWGGIPKSAFYVGLGASLNSADFGKQSIYAVGTSNVYRGNSLVATGSADGPPVKVNMDTQFSLSPSVQAGYYARFPASLWLWGGKFEYNHTDASSIEPRVLIPQIGSFTDQVTQATTPFTGNAIVRSSQTSVVQQMSLMPIVGRAFGNGFFYGGAGVTYSELRADQYQLVGFADINGDRQDISGAPQDFRGSAWAFGGAATVGATYFVDASWFVDLNYKYGMTPAQKFNYSSSYSNSNTSNGTQNVGTLVGYSSYSLTTQAVTLTLNRAF